MTLTAQLACIDPQNIIITARFAELVEKKHPGKGAASAALTTKYWDTEATVFAKKHLTNKFPDNNVLVLTRELATRNPQLVIEMEALKNS